MILAIRRWRSNVIQDMKMTFFIQRGGEIDTDDYMDDNSDDIQTVDARFI
jgi:hypothetical protein